MTFNDQILRRFSSRKILEHGKSAFDKNNSIGSKCPTKDGPAQGKDIISVLLRARRQDMFRTGLERNFCRMGVTCLTMISKKSNFWTQWLKKGEFTLDSAPSLAADRTPFVAE
ncbi:hypothetical protein B0H14DRAFT_2610354 [Mycena olivaceomarginata]|nr:hypothetical protein B0H14DRAFT_2610354 [Mycena olivaceomarginata]